MDVNRSYRSSTACWLLPMAVFRSILNLRGIRRTDRHGRRRRADGEGRAGAHAGRAGRAVQAAGLRQRRPEYGAGMMIVGRMQRIMACGEALYKAEPWPYHRQRRNPGSCAPQRRSAIRSPPPAQRPSGLTSIGSTPGLDGAAAIRRFPCTLLSQSDDRACGLPVSGGGPWAM